MKKIYYFMFLASLISSSALARDMHGRLGLGYNGEFGNTYATPIAYRIPGISLKYAFTRDIAIEGVIGMATTSPTNSVTALKFFKNLFYETNLNFYFTIGGGVIATNGAAGGAAIAAFGAEFFIPGVDSLGFAVETGATFDNVTGSYTVRTLGVSFLDAGIHFYF